MLLSQFPVGLANGVGDGLGDGERVVAGDGCEVSVVCQDAVGFEEVLVGLRGDDEAGRHADAGAPQFRDIGGFAADQRSVRGFDFVKCQDVGHVRYGMVGAGAPLATISLTIARAWSNPWSTSSTSVASMMRGGSTCNVDGRKSAKMARTPLWPRA